MPLYDYVCTSEKCKKEFEEKVSLTDYDTAVVKCPECTELAERKITAQRSNHTSWKHWRL